MGLSKIYLGADVAVEKQFRERVSGGNLALLHKTAQRIMFGILFANRVSVDMDAQLAVLMRRFESDFVAHLYAALVYIWRKDGARAAQHLARARELVVDDHPWAYLVPDAIRARCELPEVTLSEVEPGRVWRLLGETREAYTHPHGNRSVATFVRLRSGALVCINPVAMNDAVTAQLRALGDVSHIVAPAKYHNTYLNDAKERFPAAKVWGVPAQRGYPEVAHIQFDGYLDDDQPLFPGELDQVTMQGIDIGDVFFFDRPSRTLLVTDAVFFPAPRESTFRNFFGDLYWWAWGILDRPALPSYQPLIWQDLAAYQRSIRRALELDFDRVASSHGEWRAIAGNAREVLAGELAWLLDVRGFTRLNLVLDFVKRHPGLTWRFIQESRQQAKLAR